jgi:putative sterol carrier protein
MAKKEEVEKLFQEIIERLNDVGPDVAADWGGSLLYVIPDLGTGWLLKMAMDGTVESLTESTDEEAALGVVELDSDTFVDIYTGRNSPMNAVAAGKCKMRKAMDALVKILPNTIDQ